MPAIERLLPTVLIYAALKSTLHQASSGLYIKKKKKQYGEITAELYSACLPTYIYSCFVSFFYFRLFLSFTHYLHHIGTYTQTLDGDMTQ